MAGSGQKKLKPSHIALIITFTMLSMIGRMEAVTVSTTVTISNRDPIIKSDTISCTFGTDSDGTYQPSVGSRNDNSAGNYPVWCTVVVSDNNSYQNISKVWAEFYHSGSSLGAADNYDIHYSAPDCLSLNNGSGTDEGYNCTFGSFKYYANPGTWTFTVNVWDGGAGNNASDSNTQTINSQAGLEVQSLLNFGLLSPGMRTDPLSKTLSINNTGNSNGIVVVTGSDMNCSRSSLAASSDIPSSSVKYAFSGISYASACGTLGTGAEWDCDTFTIQGRDVSSSNDINVSYWGIEVPTGVGGLCNARLTFDIT